MLRASACWKAAGSVAFRLGFLAMVGLAAPVAQAQAQTLQAKMAVCAACHGADGNASLVGAPSLAGQPKIFIENQLVMIREGMRSIPVMQGMLNGVTDEEIAAMAAHYAALPLKKPATDKDARLYPQGEKLANTMRCNICHLPNYMGREQIPRLAGQREDYLLHSMRQFKSNQAVGRDTVMAASLYGVSDDDIKAMAYFLSRIQPPP